MNLSKQEKIVLFIILIGILVIIYLLYRRDNYANQATNDPVLTEEDRIPFISFIIRHFKKNGDPMVIVDFDNKVTDYNAVRNNNISLATRFMSVDSTGNRSGLKIRFSYAFILQGNLFILNVNPVETPNGMTSYKECSLTAFRIRTGEILELSRLPLKIGSTKFRPVTLLENNLENVMLHLEVDGNISDDANKFIPIVHRTYISLNNAINSFDHLHLQKACLEVLKELEDAGLEYKDKIDRKNDFIMWLYRKYQKEKQDRGANWICDGRNHVPLRLNSEGDVECMSSDGRNCDRQKSHAQCERLISDVKYTVKPLACGNTYAISYGITGYEDKNHWCNALTNKKNTTQNTIKKSLPELIHGTRPDASGNPMSTVSIHGRQTDVSETRIDSSGIRVSTVLTQGILTDASETRIDSSGIRVSTVLTQGILTDTSGIRMNAQVTQMNAQGQLSDASGTPVYAAKPVEIELNKNSEFNYVTRTSKTNPNTYTMPYVSRTFVIEITKILEDFNDPLSRDKVLTSVLATEKERISTIAKKAPIELSQEATNLANAVIKFNSAAVKYADKFLSKYKRETMPESYIVTQVSPTFAIEIANIYEKFAEKTDIAKQEAFKTFLAERNKLFKIETPFDISGEMTNVTTEVTVAIIEFYSKVLEYIDKQAKIKREMKEAPTSTQSINAPKCSISKLNNVKMLISDKNYSYSVDNDGVVYMCGKPCSENMAIIGKSFDKISSDGTNLYGVATDGNIFSCKAPCINTPWIQIPGKLKSIDASHHAYSYNDAFLYGVNEKNETYVCKKPCSNGAWTIFK